ncbi:alpha/beta fold hydrolase [Massilia sp. DWR3-1-1]|uniref:alpha/beta fold hydrolase n=1 Tax=Massilia sp. DWR3-1-1 TaxID=2804559 RepID=UPI003CF95F1F
MFNLPAGALALLLTSMASACLAAPAGPGPAPAAGFGCATPHQRLDQHGFVPIGGIEQWVTVKGDDCANPIILFVHGGPGNPLSPYSDALYGAWSKQFTLVHWDQRGAGMTYGRNKPSEATPLSIAQLRDDGLEVAAWLGQRYGQRKVILWGSSWGSILAVHMALQRPALFYAYLGTAQVVGYRANQAVSYPKLRQLVHEAGDVPALAILDGVGAPPWTDPRSFGKVRKIIRRYEAKVTTAAPAAWWTPAPLYATAQAQADYEGGEDYAFLQFVGLRGDGMFSTVDLPSLGTQFAIPVFFVEGAQDLLATPDVAQRYFDSIEAPAKAIVVLPRAGHDPNQDVIDAQYKMLAEKILPLIER